MLLPLNVRNSIYEYLLNEGVMTAIENVNPKCIHPAVKVRNLYVMMVMKSLVSRGYVKKNFAWRTFYWCLTNEGIDYLRQVRLIIIAVNSQILHLPAEIVPATLSKPIGEGRTGVAGGVIGGSRMPTDGRLAYRRGPVGPEAGKETEGKDAGVVNEEEVHFRSNAGRGRPL